MEICWTGRAEDVFAKEQESRRARKEYLKEWERTVAAACDGDSSQSTSQVNNLITYAAKYDECSVCFSIQSRSTHQEFVASSCHESVVMQREERPPD